LNTTEGAKLQALKTLFQFSIAPAAGRLFFCGRRNSEAPDSNFSSDTKLIPRIDMELGVTARNSNLAPLLRVRVVLALMEIFQCGI
jgi:hypothetical protein